MQVHGYLRWSDQHQSKGSSLSRQTLIIDSFASELGWLVAERIVEEGVSAFRGANVDAGKLGGFSERVRSGLLLDDGEEHCLMVEKIDRLSRRDAVDALRWFTEMVDCGMTIAIADSKMVVNKVSIRVQRHQIKALLDEMDKANAYSDALSKRIKPAWEAMRNGKDVVIEHKGVVARVTVVGDQSDVHRVEVSRGNRTDVYWVNELARPLNPGDDVADRQVVGVLRQKVHTDSTCPAWLELIENRTTFRVRFDIASVIERIFTLYVTSDLGARGIAKVLNGDGVPTLRNGRCWHGSTIKALLKNRAVTGEYEHAVGRRKNGTQVIGYFPSIIENELFQAANDKGLTRIKSNHSRTSRLRHLFSDVSRCHKCDGKLTFVTKRRSPSGRFDSYGKCQSAYLNTGCDQKKSLRMIPMEDAVLDNILVLAMDDEHFIDEDLLPHIRREMVSSKAKLGGIQRRIETLLDFIAEPTFARDERFDMRLRTAQNEEAEAKIALSRVKERLESCQGAVTPQEHVRRVSEIRADLWSPDETKGFEARRKVKMALNDLMDVMYVSAEQRKVVIVLKGRVRHLVLDWHGNLIANVPLSRDHSIASDSSLVRAYFKRLRASN